MDVSDTVLITDFLSPERTPVDLLGQLRSQLLSHKPLTDLLDQAKVPLVLLNGLRQLVYANPAFLHTLDAMQGQDPIGMRPGEIWHCMQAQDSPAGCGTSYACRSCHVSTTILEAMKWGEFNDWERIQRLHFGGLEVELKAKSVYVLGEMLLLCRIGYQPYRSPIQPQDGQPAADPPQPEPPGTVESETSPSSNTPCTTACQDAVAQDVIALTAAVTGTASPASASAEPSAESLASLDRILDTLSTTPDGLVELYLFLCSCGEF